MEARVGRAAARFTWEIVGWLSRGGRFRHGRHFQLTATLSCILRTNTGREGRDAYAQHECPEQPAPSIVGPEAGRATCHAAVSKTDRNEHIWQRATLPTTRARLWGGQASGNRRHTHTTRVIVADHTPPPSSQQASPGQWDIMQQVSVSLDGSPRTPSTPSTLSTTATRLSTARPPRTAT